MFSKVKKVMIVVMALAFAILLASCGPKKTVVRYIPADAEHAAYINTLSMIPAAFSEDSSFAELDKNIAKALPGIKLTDFRFEGAFWSSTANANDAYGVFTTEQNVLPVITKIMENLKNNGENVEESTLDGKPMFVIQNKMNKNLKAYVIVSGEKEIQLIMLDNDDIKPALIKMGDKTHSLASKMNDNSILTYNGKMPSLVNAANVKRPEIFLNITSDKAKNSYSLDFVVTMQTEEDAAQGANMLKMLVGANPDAPALLKKFSFEAIGKNVVIKGTATEEELSELFKELAPAMPLPASDVSSAPEDVEIIVED